MLRIGMAGELTVNSPTSVRKSGIPNEVSSAAPLGEVSSDDPRALLAARIADSPGFRRAPKLRELFLYVVRTGLAGREDLLSEHRIGENVFGRDEHYNSSEDNIVRSQMRLLRKKLETWSEAEGASEPLHVSIPRGSYIPVFEPRTLEPVALASEPMVLSSHESQPVPVERRWRFPVALALTAMAGTVVGWWARSPDATAHSSLNPVLARLMDKNRPTLVVVQDASITLLNNALQSEFALGEFQSGAYRRHLQGPAMSADFSRLLRIIDSRQYTSLGDLSVVRSLLQAVPSEWSRLQIIHPRHLHLRQLKASNAILIGGSKANPWVQLYSEQLDFRLARPPDRTSNLCVENLRPRAGEPQAWCPDKDSYGFLAMIPQTGGPGNVLLMAGSSLEATEAAGEMIISSSTAQQLVDDIQRQLGTRDFGSFQAVIRSSRLGGTAAQREVVALRATKQSP